MAAEQKRYEDLREKTRVLVDPTGNLGRATLVTYHAADVAFV
jgi:hypothetical protein